MHPLIRAYIGLSVLTILRIFITYKPARFFGILSLVALVPGLISIARFFVLFWLGQGEGHVPVPGPWRQPRRALRSSCWPA